MDGAPQAMITTRRDVLAITSILSTFFLTSLPSTASYKLGTVAFTPFVAAGHHNCVILQDNVFKCWGKAICPLCCERRSADLGNLVQ